MYEFEGNFRNTIPDFIVNDKIIIEVKPQRKLDLIEKERKKIEAIDIYCKNNGLSFEVWTEKDLTEK